MNIINPENSNIYIDEDDSGKRLDAFLSALHSDLSRSYIQKQIKSQNVLLNGVPAKSSQLLKIDDEISVNFEIINQIELEPEDLPIEVLYEDESMAVIKKPKNMLTHPTSSERSGTLVNALLYRFASLSDCNGEMRPGIVHRLDRNTCGLLMIAKTNEAYEFLKTQMKERTVTKKYYAIVSGTFDADKGSISTNIGRHPSRPEKMAVTKDGKAALTHFKVIERLNGYTFLDITLETGRTHQIRVHLSSIGHPVINDSMYGGARLPVKTQEQVLQAYSLTFISPYDKTEHTVKIEFDDDIIKSLNYLRNKK